MGLFRQSYSVYGDIAHDQSPVRFTDFDNLEELEVEALAQHYGLHTRLLDWSSSVYVASFFALSRLDLCASGLVSVWAMDMETFRKIRETELAFVKDVYQGNVRNLWQMGVFTRNYSSLPNTLDLFRAGSTSFGSEVGGDKPLLIRFDFPISSEERVEDDLQMMRINSMSIFPGIEGIVSWIKKKDAY